jgi:carboxylesterase type B
MTNTSGTPAARRRFLQQASLVVAGSVVAPGLVFAQGGDPVAETTNGNVRGVTIDGVKLFRGIPYGGDTSGKNRFMPPTKVAAWAGVRDCTNWGHLAPQRTNNSPNDYTRMVGWNNYRGAMSEDGDLATLQSLPFEQIIAAQTTAGPVMDGVVVPRDPFDPDAPAISADVPMLIGTCLEDAGLNLTDWDADEAALESWVDTQVPGKSAEVVAAYRKLYPSKRPYLIKAMIATDRGGRRNSVTQAERKVAQGTAPVFMYRWDWPVLGGGNKWGATHGADLSASFANPTTDMTLNTPEAKIMANRLGSAFIAFANTGNPDTLAIPHWPAYNTSQRPVMIFDTQTRVENDPNRECRLMWDRLLA